MGIIPTGHFALDFAINFGCDPSNVDLNTLEGYDSSTALGLPLGKVVEIFGEEGGGKSSLAYRAAGAAQKLGYTVAWLDAEHSFSRALAEINGCDPNDIIYPNNNLCAEEFLDLIHSLCNAEKIPMVKNGKKTYVDSPKVIVLDSIASLIPRAVDESLSDQQFMGLLARLMSQRLSKIAASVEANQVLLIFINQLREKIGLNFGNQETTPGGRALRHCFYLRLKVTKRKNKDANLYKIDEESGEEILIGNRSYVNIIKNRFAKPLMDSIDVPIYYEKYFPDLEDIVFDAGRQTKLISIRKGVFSWNDIKVEGRKAFISKVRENNLFKNLLAEIKDKAKEENILLSPELIQYKENDDASGMAKQVLRSGEVKDNSSVKKKSKKTGGEEGS
jgi:recombination protein RecA